MSNVTHKILIDNNATRPFAWIGILPVAYETVSPVTIPFHGVIDTGFDGFVMLPHQCFEQICTFGNSRQLFKKYIRPETGNSRIETNRGDGTLYCANAWLFAETAKHPPKTQSNGLKVIYKKRPLIVLDQEPSLRLKRPLIGMDLLINGGLNLTVHLASVPYYAQIKN